METAPVSNSSHHQETLNNLNNALDRVLESEPTGTEVTIKATPQGEVKVNIKRPGILERVSAKIQGVFQKQPK